MDQKNGRRAALHNLGCKVNAYETEAMQQMLEKAGYTIVPFEAGADVYVINTCSVTNIADRKSRQMLHRARKFNPDAAIAAVGCYVQTARDKTHLPVEADIILGNNQRGELVSALEAWFAGQGRVKREQAVIEHVADLAGSCGYEQLSLEKTAGHTRAFIKVQDGCNQFCSYCIIPYARGRVRSREICDVLREVRTLAESGIREIVLTGIHLSSYGTDLAKGAAAGANDRAGASAQMYGTGLLELIGAVSETEGISRIRLGSLEPGIITEAFVKALAANRKLCPHFHLSLQSGSDRVLKRMNRHYTTDEFAARCDMLRKHFSDPALTTDIIAGFPGETEEEFQETVAFLKRIRFYETHIFKYSAREGTRAATMKDQVSEQVKTVRSAALIELGEAFRLDYEKRREGKPCEVLFEEKIGIDGAAYYAGHTREYIRAVIPAGADYTNCVLKGVLREPVNRKGGPRLFTPQ